MENKQQTILKPVSLSGVGLHTGVQVNLTFNPAPENFGFKFQRIDLEDKPIVEADVDYVTDTNRGTTLTKGNAQVGTVEHVLASLVAMGLDNVLIELDGPECPIMDGSAMEFVKAIESVGIKEQSADREYFEVPSNIYYRDTDQNIEMIAMPLDGFRLTCMIDFNNPVIGSQHASILSMSELRTDIVTARTFCPLSQLESLFHKGLIKGGDINNAIVVVDKEVSSEELERLAKLFNKSPNYFQLGSDGILNDIKLWHQNEPARHKLLDMVGDLSLVGMPIKAQIMAARPGHQANVEFARKIKKAMKLSKKSNVEKAPSYDPNQKPIFNSVEITKLLPHRHPFLLVDKIIELNEKQIVGIKNITFDEWFFPGHFPGNPVMPGVLMVEALAQCGGVLILNDVPDPENYSTYFLKIDKTRFKDMVRPGDTLILKCELIAPVRRGVCQMRAQGFVGSKLVIETELMAQIVKE